MRISNGGPAASLDAIVLFPFDDHSVPFQSGIGLHLQGKQTGHGNKPAVPLGEPGAHDLEDRAVVRDSAGRAIGWVISPPTKAASGRTGADRTYTSSPHPSTWRVVRHDSP